MKTKLILFILSSSVIFSASGQKATIELAFTGINNTTHVQLDSIKVMNRTQGGDTVLYYPDTTLTLNYPVGIPSQGKGIEEFTISRNYPNPVKESTTIEVWMPSASDLHLSVCDLLGRQVTAMDMQLKKGNHTFRFTPGSSTVYLFSGTWNGITRSIKISATTAPAGSRCTLAYSGFTGDGQVSKSFLVAGGFTFSPGDLLLLIGYAGMLESGMLDAPGTDETYFIQFATNIPCPGIPTVNYEGQIYNTIQVFGQCWLKENLNVGTMIPGTGLMTNNDTIEKYCYDDLPANCNQYGGLYTWDEMMQYVTAGGVQGICPPGWHVPNDEEWKVLEGAADSQYGIGDTIWDIFYERGIDGGTNLKSTTGWYSGGNGTDIYGFTGLPGGYHSPSGFDFKEQSAYWFMSTQYTLLTSFVRFLRYEYPDIYRSWVYKESANSVRCMKDN